MPESSQIMFKLKCKILYGEKLSMQDAHSPTLAWVKMGSRCRRTL